MKINLKDLRERTDQVIETFGEFTIGFFAVGGYLTGAVSFMFVLKDLGIDKYSMRLFYNILFGSAKILIGVLIVLWGFKLGLWLWAKINEQRKIQREELLKIIREEIKAKKKK